MYKRNRDNILKKKIWLEDIPEPYWGSSKKFVHQLLCAAKKGIPIASLEPHEIQNSS